MTDHDPWQFHKSKEAKDKEENGEQPGKKNGDELFAESSLQLRQKNDGQKEQQNEERNNIITPLAFEDNFSPQTTGEAAQLNSQHHQPLPDSVSYLQSLERKLEKVKKGSKLVDALSEKRQDCLRTLLQSDHGVGDNILNNNETFALDTPISNSSRESGVQEFLRHLQPIQPVTVGETVQIVDYDQLEQHRQAVEIDEEEVHEIEAEPKPPLSR